MGYDIYRNYIDAMTQYSTPYGTDGWHVNLKLQNGRKLTAMVYCRYHIMCVTAC